MKGFDYDFEDVYKKLKELLFDVKNIEKKTL